MKISRLFSLLGLCAWLSIILLGTALWAIAKDLWSVVRGGSRQRIEWPEARAASSFTMGTELDYTLL